MALFGGTAWLDEAIDTPLGDTLAVNLDLSEIDVTFVGDPMTEVCAKSIIGAPPGNCERRVPRRQGLRTLPLSSEKVMSQRCVTSHAYRVTQLAGVCAVRTKGGTVAIEQHELTAHQRPISELDGYTVEAGDTDPRGWNAIGGNGQRIGRVVDLIVDTDSMKVRKLVVEPDDNTSTEGRRSLLIDIDGVDLRQDSREVFVFGQGLTPTGEGTDTRGSETSRDVVRETLTRSEEELRIGTRQVNRGEVRVGKHVRTEQVSQPVTTRREEVVIERRPVTAEGGTAAIGEDEIRIPLMEEEVVVEKRPVVKEELVIGKRVIEEQDVVTAEVRREEFEIDDTVDEVTESGTSRDRRGRE